jgi:hypothetical protein
MFNNSAIQIIPGGPIYEQHKANSMFLQNKKTSTHEMVIARFAYIYVVDSSFLYTRKMLTMLILDQPADDLQSRGMRQTSPLSSTTASRLLL